MKILVISDLHGSKEAGLAFKEAYSLHKPDFVLCLGDILYHGPRNDFPVNYNPKELIEIMNEFKSEIVSVRGNCDSEVDQMVLQFPINADKNIFYLENRKVFATHGHLFTYEDALLKEGDIFISGHTHILKTDLIDGAYILNPGSMSLPKGGNEKTYGILESNKFSVYNLDHSLNSFINL